MSAAAVRDSLPEFAVYPRKVCGCVMRVETGRIRENANRRRSDNLRLLSKRSAGLIERKSIRTDAEDRQYLRLIKLDFGTQLLSTLRELVGAQLGRCYCRAIHQISNAIAKGQQLRIFRWLKESRGKSSVMKCGPEAIAWTCEVVSNRRRIDAWINATEQYSQVWGNDVRYRLADSSGKVCFRWLHNPFTAA